MSSSANKHFLHQRFTAMIQVPLVIWLVISIMKNIGATRAEFMAWVGEPLTAFLMLTFVVSICYHMYLGMSDVIDDYVHKPSGRKGLTMLNALFALVLGAVAVFSIIVITIV